MAIVHEIFWQFCNINTVINHQSLLFTETPVVEASSTMNGKEISYPTLKQAIYSLTAFLNVRDFFFRFSEDLVVSILRLLRWMDT